AVKVRRCAVGCRSVDKGLVAGRPWHGARADRRGHEATEGLAPVSKGGRIHPDAAEVRAAPAAGLDRGKRPRRSKCPSSGTRASKDLQTLKDFSADPDTSSGVSAHRRDSRRARAYRCARPPRMGPHEATRLAGPPCRGMASSAPCKRRRRRLHPSRKAADHTTKVGRTQRRVYDAYSFASGILARKESSRSALDRSFIHSKYGTRITSHPRLRSSRSLAFDLPSSTRLEAPAR
ncbi:hypothetical protein M885DRAFT_18258, partial [Pelagophyceae sp. CCMP2097]